jgi:hypothetical protein
MASDGDFLVYLTAGLSGFLVLDWGLTFFVGVTVVLASAAGATALKPVLAEVDLVAMVLEG